LKNTPKTKRKERNHKGAAHHSIPAFIGGKLGRTVENTLKTKQRKESQRAAHHSTPAFIGRNWVGLLKNTLKTKHKGITKKQHITQSLLSGVKL
jgi:hypothetical protein